MAGLGSSTVDQVLKYTKYPKYIPSTSSTFISSTSTSTHIKFVLKSGWTYRAE